MKTIGKITHGQTNEFQGATFLNDASIAYEILDELLNAGWYPENADTEWTDIAVLDDRYYACFGEDAVTAQSANIIYVEIVPTQSMIDNYNYFRQY